MAIPFFSRFFGARRDDNAVVASPSGGGYGLLPAPRQLDFQTLGGIGVVAACVRKRAEAVMQLKLVTTGERDEAFERVFNYNPHPRWSGPQRLEHLTTAYDIFGESHELVLRNAAGEVEHLVPLPAGTFVEYISADSDEYGLNGDAAVVHLPNRAMNGGFERVSLAWDSVLSYYNAAWPGRGNSPLSNGIADLAELLKEQSSQVGDYYKRGIQSRLVGIPAQGTGARKLGVDDLTKIANHMNAAYGGKQGFLAASPGMDVKQLDWKLIDSDFVNARKHLIAEIGSYYGVTNPQLNLESSVYSGGGTAVILNMFYRQAIAPLATKLEAEAQRKIFPDMRTKLRLDEALLLRGSPKERAEIQNLQLNRTKTLNEIRRSNYDDPLPGGDAMQPQSTPTENENASL